MPFFQHLIFFVTYELAQKARVLHISWVEMFVRDKHTSLLDPFISYEKMNCCEYSPGAVFTALNFLQNL
jgi:hypothetical protein